jgi:hypothetical protein
MRRVSAASSASVATYAAMLRLMTWQHSSTAAQQRKFIIAVLVSLLLNHML